MNTYYDLFEGSQLKTVKCIAEISKCQTLVNRHGHDRLVTIENNIDNQAFKILPIENCSFIKNAKESLGAINF